jgi:hypothetical protein
MRSVRLSAVHLHGSHLRMTVNPVWLVGYYYAEILSVFVNMLPIHAMKPVLSMNDLVIVITAIFSLGLYYILLTCLFSSIDCSKVRV